MSVPFDMLISITIHVTTIKQISSWRWRHTKIFFLSSFSFYILCLNLFQDVPFNRQPRFTQPRLWLWYHSLWQCYHCWLDLPGDFSRRNDAQKTTTPRVDIITWRPRQNWTSKYPLQFLSWFSTPVSHIWSIANLNWSNDFDLAQISWSLKQGYVTPILACFFEQWITIKKEDSLGN